MVRNRPNKPANDSYSGFLASPVLIPPQDQPNGHDDDRDGRADQSPDSQPLDDAPGHRRDELGPREFREPERSPGRGRIRVVRVTAQALDCLALFDSVHAVAADPVFSTCGALHGEGP